MKKNRAQARPYSNIASFLVARANAPASRAGGFSLLEVLVALAIMAMSLGVIYGITGGSARQTLRLQSQQAALQLADGLLATVHSVPSGGLQSRDAAQGYAWAISTRPWPAPGSSPQSARLHEVTVQVQWPDGDAAQTLTLSTLRPERLPEPDQGPR